MKLGNKCKVRENLSIKLPLRKIRLIMKPEIFSTSQLL